MYVASYGSSCADSLWVMRSGLENVDSSPASLGTWALLAWTWVAPIPGQVGWSLSKKKKLANHVPAQHSASSVLWEKVLGVKRWGFGSWLFLNLSRARFK